MVLILKYGRFVYLPMLLCGIWTKNVIVINLSLPHTNAIVGTASYLSWEETNLLLPLFKRWKKKSLNTISMSFTVMISAGWSTKGPWALVFANHTGRASQLQGDEQSWCPNESKLTNAVPIAMQRRISDAPVQVQKRLETASQVVIKNEPAFSLICVCVSRFLSPTSPWVVDSRISCWQNQSPRLRHREERRSRVHHRARGWRQHVWHHNQRAHSRGHHYPQKGME